MALSFLAKEVSLIRRHHRHLLRRPWLFGARRAGADAHSGPAGDLMC
jgi:hypothetical protein